MLPKVNQSLSLSDWVTNSTEQLKSVDIPSARLDAELILADTLNLTRTYIHTHPEKLIPQVLLPILQARLQLRISRVPIAYILGYKEFYGRRFAVTPATLVPRPETEDIITVIKQLEGGSTTPKTAIDVGTGSGNIGITIALELPHIDVTLSDISHKALTVAKSNTKALQCKNIHISPPGSLLSNITGQFDYIIANLPYVDKKWTDTSPELNYEPATALYANKSGLELIFQLIKQVPNNLKLNGYLLLEADPSQHQAIIKAASQYKIKATQNLGYCLVLQLQVQ